MNEVNDSIQAEKPECEIKVCDDPRSWKRQAQIEETRAQELMETCDRFYNENQLLKGLFAREYCGHETDLSILKEYRKDNKNLEAKMWRLRTIFREYGDQMRIPKDLKAEILDLLEF